MKFIVLDLDNTLIHSEPCTKEKANIIFPGNEYYNCVKRPGFDEFMKYLHDNVDGIIVWSAGTPEYVDKVISITFPYKPDKIFDSKFCLPKNNNETTYPVKKPLLHMHMKILEENGYNNIFDMMKELDDPDSNFPNMYNTRIIDDREEIAVDNPNLHIRVKEFMGDPKDRELYRVMDILDEWIYG